MNSSDVESPPDETEPPPLSTEGPTNPTTDVTEPTPPDTTDQPSDGTPGTSPDGTSPDGTDDETPGTSRFEVTRRLEFPALVLASTSGPRVETISVTNTGTIPLQIADVSFTENPGKVFTTSGCKRNPLPAGAQCSIQVRFQPPKAGSYHAVLAVDVEGLGPQTVELLGRGEGAPPSRVVLR